jgi:soluble lytic murein transglycosylase-like protein
MSDPVFSRNSISRTSRRPRWRRAWSLMAVISATMPAFAGEPNRIFQLHDTPGEIHLTDDAAADGADLVPPARARRSRRDGSDADFAPFVQAAARRERLDPNLLLAVIAVESRSQPSAVSPRGAAGLMQLMPAVARAYGVTDVFDPAQNIAAGARLLRTLMDRYHQDVARALAAYNAGPPAIDRWRTQSDGWPSVETSLYVPRVLARFAMLRDEPHSQASCPVTSLEIACFLP